MQRDIPALVLGGGGLVAALVSLVGLVFTYMQFNSQIDQARQQHIVDEYNHAIDQLSSDRVPVRLTGVFELEQIAQTSQASRGASGANPGESAQSAITSGDYHALALEILAAEARALVPPTTGLATPSTDDGQDLVELPAILGAIGRLGGSGQLDLSGADLRRARLGNLDLAGINLNDANLQGVSLVETQLSGSNLQRAHLDGANLTNANLEGANLSSADLSPLAGKTATSLVRADLKGAVLVGTNLQGANLTGATFDAATILVGANLAGADLEQTHGLTPTHLCMATIDERTKLPATLQSLVAKTSGSPVPAAAENDFCQPLNLSSAQDGTPSP